ncbi:AbrB family transcriptional regulator [Desertibacillus haloalkaliphilus]|uniref:AbrB family transcriptional regulator n=1 Tax=Desertibacillus haloalkaliphilus TaxID=1328930 RepID=UPI001C25C898|nr:AbrB family transcriptional regulator [Desertibacillus haloalkaliphilus]MBU8904974.1 AbrB family transcriptional regulator [Desertibacillus haloalkaliphilus]
MDFFQFLLFIFLSIIGGYIGMWLRLPVGSIIGAMFAVGLAKTFMVLQLEQTVVISFFMQTTLGLMVGLNFLSLSLNELRKLSISLVAITGSVFVMTIGIGYVVATFTGLDTGLTILSAAPGGMIEMATIAKALSMHAPIVIMLHLTRVLSVMTIFPILLEFIYRRQNKHGGNQLETMGHN